MMDLSTGLELSKHFLGQPMTLDCLLLEVLVLAVFGWVIWNHKPR
jgi:hypothetical protein